MRIISGKYKGRRISPPKNLPVRPTTDMSKEALFNVLNNHFNFSELKILELFAGTGSISYEFASARRLTPSKSQATGFWESTFWNTLVGYQLIGRTDKQEIQKKKTFGRARYAYRACLDVRCRPKNQTFGMPITLQTDRSVSTRTGSIWMKHPSWHSWPLSRLLPKRTANEKLSEQAYVMGEWCGTGAIVYVCFRSLFFRMISTVSQDQWSLSRKVGTEVTMACEASSPSLAGKWTSPASN